MSHSDSNFYKSFAFVLGALVLFTLFIIYVANSLSPKAPDDPLARAEQQRAIAPIGQSRVEGGVVEETSQVAPETTEAKTAAVAETKVADAKVEETVSKEEAKVEAKVEEIATPAANAETGTAEVTAPAAKPETTDAAKVATATAATAVAMTSVSASDIPVKVRATVATNCAGCHNPGINGAARSDDAQAWTELGQKGVDELTASVINGKGSMPARGGSNLNDEEIKQAVQLMHSKATGGSSKTVSSGVAAVAAGSTAAATTTAAAATTAAVATTATVATAAIPDDVKKVVDSTCAACHIAGVANAPKYGDKDAWTVRMEKGLDAVVASAIDGKGAMPARGGSQLNDEQMRLAVEYMLGK